MRSLLASVVALGVGAGCSCQPELPNATPPPNIDTSLPLDSGPTDTAPPPPCDAPEVEPNDVIGTATPLPMEKVGCGVWSAPGDIDYFAFELVEEAWIRVWVEAKVLGSVGDAHLVVQGEDGSAALRTDDDDTTDASLVFPAVPQVFNVQLIEQNFQGGERYFYDVMASVTKAPIDWTREELEPNDGSVTAESVVDGEVIFGDMVSNVDGDWYKVVIPPGKHTLGVVVDAYALGSGGDFSLMLYDDTLALLPLGCDPCAITGPLGSGGHDPALEWDSAGDEVVYFRIFEQDGKNGSAVWYAMTITLEAS